MFRRHAVYMSEPLRTQRGLFWLLVLITLIGNGLVINAIHMIAYHDQSVNLPLFIELGCTGILVMPWSVKLPSGASWRPGMPLMMMSIFLVPPSIVAVIPVAGLVLSTAKSHAPWWKYPETIAHVALGLFVGAQTYVYLTHLLGESGLSRTFALVIALFIHLIVNRLISALIVTMSTKRRLYEQLKLTMREIHWGYANSYLLIVLASMLNKQFMAEGILLVAILQMLIFLAVVHYSHIEKLRSSIRLDGLTCLENRTAWEQLCAGGKISLQGGLLGVVDVNNFKNINDKYGHLVGDLLLRKIAEVLKAVLPRHARIFRIGGDEFVIFINKRYVTDLVADVHEGMLRQYSSISQLGEEVSVSVGQAVFPDDGATLTELFRVADQRMYKEKKSRHFSDSGMYYGIPASILSLILAIESRDPYTAGHNLRVAYYSWQLATNMGLGEAMLKSIFRAGLVHDVGKIGISDVILNKHGKLTSEEFQIVQQHSVIGVEMCNKLDFSKVELDCIHHHHERWDGSGYPTGLSGSDIPLLARIVAVADVYDALTSARVYRGERTHEEAMRYLFENSARQFDPECIDEWVLLNKRRFLKLQFLDWVKDTTFKNLVSELATGR